MRDGAQQSAQVLSDADIGNVRDNDNQRNNKLSTSIINELVMVFDVHRLMFKAIRIQIALAMQPEAKKFSDFLSEKHNF